MNSFNAEPHFTIASVAAAVEAFAPLCLQESYDNSGLQIGSPSDPVSGVLVCLTPTEDIVEEARRRGCDLVVSHHPLLFRGLKHIGSATAPERIATRAIRAGINIYSAHTNLDSASYGVSGEMAHALGMTDVRPLRPTAPGASTGLGAIGRMPRPVPAQEFLRLTADTFSTHCLRYSASAPRIVIRTVALCGGAGADLIYDAARAGADAYVTGDLRYHDFDSHGSELLLADIGHYESELGARKLLHRIIADALPELPVFVAETECNPVATL